MTEYGAVKEASAAAKLIPICPCFIAAQSLAPSPIIPTIRSCFCNYSTACAFWSGFILAKTAIF